MPTTIRISHRTLPEKIRLRIENWTYDTKKKLKNGPKHQHVCLRAKEIRRITIQKSASLLGAAA